MNGLYILTTSQLTKDKTIKFGMSTRIEYRWIDYLSVFSDSRYIYYYEFLDNLSREEILEIENIILQKYKNKRNFNYQTEYFYCNDYNEFNSSIITVLDELKINYIVHDTHIFDKKYYDNKPEVYIINNQITPNEHQLEVLNKIDDYYNDNNIGKIIHSCGLGKSLLGIFIAQKLNCKSVLIGVPNIYLQKQMKKEILKIFNNHKNILYVGGENDYNIISTTDLDIINEFINNESTECKFIITTYTSCYLLVNIKFDLKIGDEAHHLVGCNLEKTKDFFHKINSVKTLFMSATEKVIENNDDNKYSMDDENIFGKYIDIKTISWSIKNKKITDYNIIIIKNSQDEINNIIYNLNLDNNTNINLLLAAFMTLKAIEIYSNLTHILIYTNKTENAELIKKYIDIILDSNIININKENIYNKALHSNSNVNIKSESELNKFIKASYGIISSVYMFNEGFNCCRLNGVVFAENMDSDIRIVQATLRANRLDINFPDKIAYVIIPYIDTDDFMINNNSFDKCRKIIAKIRNVDETIEQKINILSNIDSKYTESKEKIKYYYGLNNSNELNKIILRLRNSKSLYSKYSEEQDEFNYIRQLNKELNIQSKEEYTNILTKEYHEKYIKYIDNPVEYFRLNGVWTNWYDFLGVDTQKFIQNKNDWINFCKEKNIKSLEDYKKICLINDELPNNPADYYDDFVSITIELELNIKRRK